MKKVYVLQNQNKLLLAKSREWVDARDLRSLFQTEHKDEAINQKVEVNAKDYTQRIHLLEVSLNEKGLPIIPDEHKPEPLPDEPKAQASLLENNTDAASSETATDNIGVDDIEADEWSEDMVEELDEEVVED